MQEVWGGAEEMVRIEGEYIEREAAFSSEAPNWSKGNANACSSTRALVPRAGTGIRLDARTGGLQQMHEEGVRIANGGGSAAVGASAFNEDIDSSDDDGDTVDLVDAADTLSPLVSELKGPSVTLQEVLDRVNRTAREAQKAFGSANKVSKQRIADYQTLYLGRKHTATTR